MADNRILTLSIYRYNPEVDAKPYMKDYQIEIPAKSDPMLLTLLERLKAEQDPSITYRRSCREGVCGSDGMNINGTNGLACITHISDLKGDKIVIRPLPGFPVIRDLAVDMSQFYQQYERIEPYLQTDELAPAKERLQSPEERAQLDGLYECILCACCTSSCPSFWWNPEKFVGPAGLLQARRFLADSRDTATDHRLNKLQDPFSVFRCRSIMNCTNVCPKGLNPTKAISEIRTQMLKQET
ncbi:MAG: succinate dehydrogenase iron-sulfur subunit [Legionella sp. 40-6]|nr:succinate dehydrogenase iron-sulfur subunit [Legionella sp.]OJX93743.1 MAG: succinate dehydrogenase iron-sulfur subunit [Legionella sp. 40-6]